MPAQFTTHRTTPRRNRRTVVLLHSSAASSRQWDTLAERLRADFEVHAIDLHGHGRQLPWAGERPLSVQDDAALALRVVERAGGAHLIGHSYGACVALHLAVARPSLVHSLALYEPVLFRLLADHEPQGPAAFEARAVGQGLRALLAAGRVADAAAFFVDYWSGEGAWAQLAWHSRASIQARMPIVAQHFDTLFAEALPRAWGARLEMPVLCLTGDRSTPAALRIGGLLQAQLPAARHETLHGLGHMGPITHPERVNPRLLRFLGVEEPGHTPVSRAVLPASGIRPAALTTLEPDYAT